MLDAEVREVQAKRARDSLSRLRLGEVDHLRRTVNGVSFESVVLLERVARR